MNFLDNVVKSSNALLKERLNNPFGTKAQPDASQQPQSNVSSTEGAPATTADTNQPVKCDQSNQEASVDQADQAEDGSSSGTGDKLAAIAADAEAVRKNAVKGAKNIGSFIFSMANKAGQTVTQTAKQVKQAVESTSILTDFTREQQEFIREHGGSMQAGDLPWSDFTDQSKAAETREQILSLSQDKRNFVRNPPNEANFEFDSVKCYPVALSLLKEDPNLSKMRFELVPKLVNEDTFWRNYFYRVSLLKQQMNQQSDEASSRRQGWASSRSSSGEGPDEVTNTEDINPVGATFSSSMDQPQSSSFSLDNTLAEPETSTGADFFVDDNDLKNKLKELNIGSFDDGSKQDENKNWEEELQKDLQEFELVPNDMSALDEQTLDEDIIELTKGTRE